MDWVQIVMLIAPLLALVIVVVAFVRSKEAPSVERFNQMYVQGETLANELRKVGMMAVVAVEQLKSNGVILTNEQAFQEAFDFINSFPGLQNVNRDIIAKVVEASYRMYKDSQEIRNG